MPPAPIVFGHRGAPRAARENTIAAFAAARASGADGVELDARRTLDGVLIVRHDPIPGVWWRDIEARDPDTPTLVDALQACAGMLVNVEIKCLPWEPDADDADHSVVRAVIDVVREHAPDAIVSSFDLTAVDAVRVFAPELVTAWLTSGQALANAAAVAAEHGHAWLHPDRATALADGAAGIADAHRAGVRVNVWTVDESEEMRALADAGVDAIVTNVPDVAVATFATGRRS
jgi:glycerophosphoryl diester phosphodiesterase